MIQRSHLLRDKQLTIPGILGGLGPLAHIAFEQRLIQQNVLRGARCDQDHPLWFMVSATPTPDRTASLQGLATDCTPWLTHYGHLLENMGADFLVVTCNTAHAFYPTVQSQLRIPWLHLMDCTAKYICQHWSTVRNIGILATDGTLQVGLYSQSLARVDLSPITPELQSPIQQQIMEAIYAPDWGIKSSGIWVSDHALTTLNNAFNWLVNQGADVVIAGCTEISVGLNRLQHTPIPWIDPLEVIADITLDLVFGCPQNHVQVSIS